MQCNFNFRLLFNADFKAVVCVISPDKTLYGADDVGFVKKFANTGKDVGWSAVNFDIVLRNSRNIAQLGRHLAIDPMESSSGLAIQGLKPVLILTCDTDDNFTIALGKISLALY